MSTTTITTKTGFAAQEPVIVGAAVAWLLVQVGAIIVGRTHLLTDTEWSALSSTLVPVISAAALALIATVTRRFTVPTAKVEVAETPLGTLTSTVAGIRYVTPGSDAADSVGDHAAREPLPTTSLLD